MKAWFVWVGDEWGDFVHGESAGKAKSMFWKEWAQEADEWINLRPIRVPELDNVPLTSDVILKHLKDNGIKWEDVEDYGNWWPICDCEVCQGKETK